MGLYLPAYRIAIENDVYSQIGLVMLIGLAAKNSILIIAFAKAEYENGKPLVEAALDAARIRLRPLLMTSFAFILGCVPLWTASGAGAIARQVMGTAVIGGMLIAVGVLMYLAEKAGRQQRDLSSINLPDGVAIGMAQALAVVPGTSRSGITITAGLFQNMTRESAARFSFLLSTPAIAAAAGKALYDMHKRGGLHGVFDTGFLVGVAVSAITGCFVISWFLHYLRRSGLRPFVYYRIVFGIIVIALAFIRRPA
jgi:undecaprenyl-diphosphatase UppP